MIYKPFYTIYNNQTHINDHCNIDLELEANSEDQAREMIYKVMHELNHKDLHNWLMGGENVKQVTDQPVYDGNGNMLDFVLKKEFAQIYEAKLDYKNTNQIRFYKHSPESFLFQIRTYGPITEWNRQKTTKRNMLANVNMTFEEIERLYLYAKFIHDTDMEQK